MTDPCERPGVGRPRSEQCRNNILCACAELVQERGYLDTTIEEVAHRAGSGKQTVYRHFGNKPHLALACFVSRAATLQPPDTGSFAGDVEAVLRVLVERMRADGEGALLAGLVAEAQRDPTFADELREVLLHARRQALLSAVQRGRERGEVEEEVDDDLVLDLVFGPVWYRLLVSRAPLDEAFATHIAGMVGRAVRGSVV